MRKEKRDRFYFVIFYMLFYEEQAKKYLYFYYFIFLFIVFASHLEHIVRLYDISRQKFIQ